MAKYSSEKYTDMVIMYGEAGRNATLATRSYAEDFSDRERHPLKLFWDVFNVAGKQDPSCYLDETVVEEGMFT